MLVFDTIFGHNKVHSIAVKYIWSSYTVISILHDACMYYYSVDSRLVVITMQQAVITQSKYMLHFVCKITSYNVYWCSVLSTVRDIVSWQSLTELHAWQVASLPGSMLGQCSPSLLR